jgi:hypothetical protein
METVRVANQCVAGGDGNMTGETGRPLPEHELLWTSGVATLGSGRRDVARESSASRFGLATSNDTLRGRC